MKLGARPNILLSMADQLTPMLTGAYGHPVVQTPNLNRLVREGVRFDTAYSPSPLCAPARACLMTGTYTSTNRVYDNAAILAPDIPTFAHYLTNAGYDCVLSGKMHFVGPDQLHGFRARFTPDIAPEELGNYGGRPPWTFSRDPAWFRVEDGRGHAARAYAGSEIHIGRWHFHLAYDDEVQFRAIEYLRSRAATRRAPEGPVDTADDRPFCLVASYHHPHDPFWPPTDLWDLYEGAEIELPELPDDLEQTYSIMDRWLNANHGVHKVPDLKDPESLRLLRRAYYALVTYVDRKVGELIQILEAHGLWDNTLVVFISDHGDMLGEKGMVQKCSFYDLSARVPLIVRFPGNQYAGTVVREPVSLVDLLPALCGLGGIPAEALERHDGQDLQSPGRRLADHQVHHQPGGEPGSYHGGARAAHAHRRLRSVARCRAAQDDLQDQGAVRGGNYWLSRRQPELLVAKCCEIGQARSAHQRFEGEPAQRQGDGGHTATPANAKPRPVGEQHRGSRHKGRRSAATLRLRSLRPPLVHCGGAVVAVW